MIATLLVLASCGPAEEEGEISAEMVRDSLGRQVEKPQYGGTITTCSMKNVTAFDYTSSAPRSLSLTVTHEELAMGDWTKGPTGSGEAGWAIYCFPPINLLTGCLAESWEFPDDQTFVWHIRKGIHFQDVPPVNGREMNAEDVVYSMDRTWSIPTSYFSYSLPREENIISIEAPDKWTVVVKCHPGRTGYIFEAMADMIRIVPREAYPADEPNIDWEKAIGTGAFMLTGYVPENSMTFERNPNYWMKDPLHPKNQLPYLDEVKVLILLDESTRLAALRTGQIDVYGHQSLTVAIDEEDAQSLWKTNPDLKWRGFTSAVGSAIFWRVDKPELPWYDLDVRRALYLAIDHPTILQEVFMGHGDMLNFPASNIPEFSDIYVPLEDYPEEIQELFGYDVEKAKQLLEDAEYPDGFAMKVMCSAETTEAMELIAGYWAKIGVTMDINVVEYATRLSAMRAKTHEEAIGTVVTGVEPWLFTYTMPGNFDNASCIDDAIINEAVDEIGTLYFKPQERNEMFKELSVRRLGLLPMLMLPGGYSYNFWWPWVKSYSGENLVGCAHFFDYYQYIWVDQDLKTSMGY